MESSEPAGCAGKVVWCRGVVVGPTTAMARHHCCCVSQHFTTHGTGRPYTRLHSYSFVRRQSGRECSPHYQMFARVAKLRVSQNLGGHHLDGGQLRELQIWAPRCCHPPPLKLTAPVLSCWHFLVLVCWSMHACAFWAGCWDHASNSSSTIRVLARMLCLSRTRLCSPRTMS